MNRRRANDADVAGPDPAPLELVLNRDAGAPGLARSAVTDQLEHLGVDGNVRQMVVLLVSEVVSNAVRHSSGPSGAPVSLRCTVTPQTVHVKVTDAGDGFTPRPRDPSKPGEGYGLELLEKAAKRWGVEPEGATAVWFEIERTGPT